MSANAKFLFDVNFEDRGPGGRREPRFSEADIAAAEARGREDGLAQGRTEAAHLAAQTLRGIVEQLRMLSSAQLTSAAKAERTAVEIAAAIMRKVMPSYAERHGLGEIESMVKECLARIPEEPRVVVRAPEPLLDLLQSHMADVAAEAGFPGGVVLLADPGLGGADCRVEWADGGASRDTARLWAEIEACLVRAVSHQAGDDASAAPTETTGHQGEAHG